MLVPALLQTSLLLWLAQETLQGGKDGAQAPTLTLPEGAVPFCPISPSDFPLFLL
ncbi:unnamed protein product [Tetraodon nigroviridis]|uniref:(spotted green pufferfish) hypothetical protein n=1 Tax=Tetraodon nigroviridis TaxID=99883 RepID=Q4RWL9_TETNG|nr:unnamed protein product [Tetraodon nigroviridis]